MLRSVDTLILRSVDTLMLRIVDTLMLRSVDSLINLHTFSKFGRLDFCLV